MTRAKPQMSINFFIEPDIKAVNGYKNLNN